MTDRLFGSSGVRGVVNKDLTPELFIGLGHALARNLEGGESLLAWDPRSSSPMLASALIAGLTSSGMSVTRLGLAPTPVLAYLTRKNGFKAGMMVTASHNPPEYNGLKIFDEKGMAFMRDKEEAIEKVLYAKDYRPTDWRAIGEVKDGYSISQYVDELASLFQPEKQYRILLDLGNGAGFSVAPEVFRRLGCKIQTVHGQPDGSFPARCSEPTEEALGNLMKLARSARYDAVFAYDGDADRVSIIDELGRFVPFDTALEAYAAYTVQQRGGGLIVLPVEASMATEEAVRASGGSVKRCRVGDVFVAREIVRTNAVFGGEPCGAWIHPQIHLCPDGILSSVLFLKALEEEGKTVSDFVRRVPSSNIVRRKVPCPNQQKIQVMKTVQAQLPQSLPSPNQLDTIDGIRIYSSDWSILVRASGTEPTIRVTAESKDREIAETLAGRVIKLLEQNIGR